MARLNPTGVPIEQVEEKIGLLKAANREANLILADLKATIREGKALLSEIDGIVRGAVEDKMNEAAAEQVARLKEHTDEAIERATEGVFDRFTKLEGMILDGRRGNHRTGGESMESVIQKAKCIDCGGVAGHRLGCPRA